MSKPSGAHGAAAFRPTRFARAAALAAAAGLACAGAAGAATIDLIGASAATIKVNGAPLRSGEQMPLRARVAVTGGPVYLKVGERMLEIEDGASFVVRGNKVKVTSGVMIMINYAGMAITLAEGQGATLSDAPGDAPINWVKPAEQIPSELLPTRPPPANPGQNLRIVSPSAP